MGKHKRRYSSSSEDEGNKENERLRRKIQKLQRKLDRAPDRRESRHYVQDSSEIDDRFEPEIIVERSQSGSRSASPAPASPQLNEDILKILGDIEEPGKEYGQPIQSDVASRWMNILQKGLDTEVRNGFIKKHPSPSNCALTKAPKLNPETVASSGESTIKRDERLSVTQNQIGTSLSAIGRAITILLAENEGGGGHNLRVIEVLSDAGRLLCDVHHAQSQTRRALIAINLNKEFQDTLEKSSIDSWLFGKDLNNKLVEAKALEKSSKDLKKSQPKFKPNLAQKAPYNLNSKGPSRPNVFQQRQDGQKNFTQNRPNYQNNQSQAKYTQKYNQSMRYNSAPRYNYNKNNKQR